MKKSFERKYKSIPDSLPEIEDFIIDVINDFNISDEKRHNIELIVAEAAANCILHGNKNDESKNVTIIVETFPEKIILKFLDEGKGFDPDKVPDPTIAENILKGSGRGIHIMKSLVDNMEYIFHKSGTELILSINLE